MISRIGNLDDMVSLMPITYIDINPKPNFRLESIREEQDLSLIHI